MKRDLIAGLVGQEAVARLMHGWLLVLPLVNLILADAVVWFVITQVWRPTGAGRVSRHFDLRAVDDILA